MSINWHSDAEPLPAVLVLPPAAASLDEAHAAIELWEHYSGKTLDPTQRLTVEVMMAQTADERWAAATTGREMPRQNGKGDEVEVVELWGLVQRSEAIMHTVHDAVLLASQTQQRMLGILEGHPDLRRRVKRRWLGTGQQMIEMRNGGIIWYRTRTGGGGRGVDDIDRLVVDEAQHAAEEHLSALTPTLFANANPQMNVLGTAGIHGKSDWWWSLRIRALSADPGNYGYVGHTAETVYLLEDGRVAQFEVDVEDRGLWMLANPALHTGRGQGKEFFEEQLRRLGPAAFAREHLCVWDPPPGQDAGWLVITLEDWQACHDDKSGPLDGICFAIDVAEDRKWSAIGVSGPSGRGGSHVELTYDQGAECYDYRPGTDWVVARAKQLHGKWSRPFAIVKGSPAWSLESELRAAGVELIEVSGAEFAQACGQLYDAATQHTLKHLGQPALTTAVGGLAKRSVGGDAFVWDRRRAGLDISPAVVVTVARYAALTYQGPVASGLIDPNDWED